MASIEERVEELVKKTIEDLDYELYDVQYAKEGKDYFLRIFIDNEKGIDLNDCEKVNDAINELLDQADCIKEQYFLEVSSPGIERILRKNKHLEKSIEKEVEIKLFKPIDGKKEYVGILKKYNEENIEIEIENENKIIERSNISLIKIHYNWN
ncbi:MAG: ribosome maturation factor RimP [Clostridiaceae bacterium]|nr:ribosome maturation factor RimP [Clostridiaceae bacterium]